MPEHEARSARDRSGAVLLDRPRPAVPPRGRVIALHTARTPARDEAERRRVRGARRQALLLMIGSSLFSLAVLYGMWTLLSHLLFSAG